MNGMKPDFALALDESEAYFEQAEKARKAMDDAFRSALGKLRAVRERIATGESSGDLITDFVFRHQFAPTLAMVRRYHKLNNAIATHPGEFALVIERDEEGIAWGTHVELRPRDYNLRVRCAVGVIRGAALALDMERGVSAIPTGKHLMFSNDFPVSIGGDVLEPNRAPIPNPDDIRAHAMWRDLGASLGIPFRPKNPITRDLLGDAGCPAIEVFIGDQEVARWFDQNGGAAAVFQEFAGYVAEYFGHRMPEVSAA